MGFDETKSSVQQMTAPFGQTLRATEWENTFTNYIFNRRLISSVYKELKRKLDIKETDNPIKVWDVDLNREFMVDNNKTKYTLDLLFPVPHE